jgi:hypothetical protein
MATVTKGKTFINGELVTPEKLHQLVDAATLSPLVNADIASNAAIADTKLAQISTAGKVLPAAVQGTAVITSDSRLSDARPPTTHNHDDRYYTETEMNNLLAGKQASGSYAPATGIAPSAITGTAVITTDSRLSDARTPTSHTHAAADITSGTLAIARIPTGATATTVCIGNDSRLSDARTPTSHTHDDRYYTESEIDTKLSGLPVSGHTHSAADITSGTLAIARIPTGTTATTVCIGNDSRLSDARTPTSHTHSAADITSGTLANARTTATNANTANAIVARDASGNFSAGTITANLTGTASGNAPATGIAPSAITGTAVITTDSRLSDARTPTSHTHSAADITSGTLAIARIPTGTTATTVCIGNDSRLSDARTPTSHTHDDRYYTESEMNTLLAGKQAAGSYVTDGGNVSSIQRVTSMPASPNATTLYIVIP